MAMTKTNSHLVRKNLGQRKWRPARRRTMRNSLAHASTNLEIRLQVIETLRQFYS
jgi:hypothetical protein